MKYNITHRIIVKTQKGECIGNPLTRVHIAGVRGYSRMRDIRIGDRIQGSYIVTAITHIVTDTQSR